MGKLLTVNEVAEEFDIHRNAAKHHLDRLLDAGLLRAEFRRVNGRRGPGAGRSHVMMEFVARIILPRIILP